MTVDQSYAGASSAKWNWEGIAGGVFAGVIYATWNDSNTTHSLVKRTTSAWSTVGTGHQLGHFAEYHGAAFAAWQGGLWEVDVAASTKTNRSYDFGKTLVVF